MTIENQSEEQKEKEEKKNRDEDGKKENVIVEDQGRVEASDIPYFPISQELFHQYKKRGFYAALNPGANAIISQIESEITSQEIEKITATEGAHNLLIESYNKEIGHLETELQRIQSGIEEYQGNLGSLDEKIIQTEADLNDLRRELIQTLRELGQAKRNVIDTRISELKNEIAKIAALQKEYIDRQNEEIKQQFENRKKTVKSAIDGTFAEQYKKINDSLTRSNGILHTIQGLGLADANHQVLMFFSFCAIYVSSWFFSAFTVDGHFNFNPDTSLKSLVFTRILNQFEYFGPLWSFAIFTLLIIALLIASFLLQRLLKKDELEDEEKPKFIDLSMPVDISSQIPLSHSARKKSFYNILLRFSPLILTVGSILIITSHKLSSTKNSIGEEFNDILNWIANQANGILLALGLCAIFYFLTARLLSDPERAERWKKLLKRTLIIALGILVFIMLLWGVFRVLSGPENSTLQNILFEILIIFFWTFLTIGGTITLAVILFYFNQEKNYYNTLALLEVLYQKEVYYSTPYRVYIRLADLVKEHSGKINKLMDHRNGLAEEVAKFNSDTGQSPEIVFVTNISNTNGSSPDKRETSDTEKVQKGSLFDNIIGIFKPRKDRKSEGEKEDNDEQKSSPYLARLISGTDHEYFSDISMKLKTIQSEIHRLSSEKEKLVTEKGSIYSGEMEFARYNEQYSRIRQSIHELNGRIKAKQLERLEKTEAIRQDYRNRLIHFREGVNLGTWHLKNNP